MSTEQVPAERFQPTTTETTEPFWEATRSEIYLVQWCTGCDAPLFYPREACPHCLSIDDLTWRPSRGTGRVYAHSVQHRPAHPGLAGRVPYMVALIDLDAGAADGEVKIRIMANLIDADPEAVQNGDAVALVWEPLADGRNLAVFRPVPAEESGDA